MENLYGILKCQISISISLTFRTPFKKSDPRLSIALESVDPRIHFALNCGAKSCPPIKTFSAKGEVQYGILGSGTQILDKLNLLKFDYGGLV